MPHNNPAISEYICTALSARSLRRHFYNLCHFISTKIQTITSSRQVKSFSGLCLRITWSRYLLELDLSLQQIVQIILGERQPPDILEGEVAKLTNKLEHQNEQLEEDNLCDALTQEWQTSKA